MPNIRLQSLLRGEHFVFVVHSVQILGLEDVALLFGITRSAGLRRGLQRIVVLAELRIGELRLRWNRSLKGLHDLLLHV